MEFQSYQFRQINPDLILKRRHKNGIMVSIVSIQTDQSRLRIFLRRPWLSYRGFNRINSDRSIPTGKRCIILDLVRALFQSYQFRQINPDERDYWYVSYYQVSIVSIQTDQSRRFWAWIWKTPIVVVSIVSIQTDQSRLGFSTHELNLPNTGFNRINSDRSIPTRKLLLSRAGGICFNRINSDRSIPTRKELSVLRYTKTSFNRINSDRSIPTQAIGKDGISVQSMFQSYQFRQINPDVIWGTIQSNGAASFNRINSDRSIPTFNRVINNSSITKVSIVSIQTDQSRHVKTSVVFPDPCSVSIVSIQTDQSRRH